MGTWVRREQRYAGKIISLWVGEARLDEGAVVDREMVAHAGSVAIVPVLDAEASARCHRNAPNVR